MELLLQAIEKKLANVDSERNRWMEYKTEHEQAGNNLREFQKSFRKEILVPIGSKALMPGHLYHTNEILVSMYRGLFVKCSTDKALNVCEHRIGEANKRIDALNVEHKMYRDRLELPVDENVFGDLNTGPQDIIEEYNEEDEKKWREEHKIRMRKYKQAEAEERKQQVTDSDIDIDAIFEQAELMEELESELEQLNVCTDEQLQQHLQGNGENLVKDMIETGEKSPQFDLFDAQIQHENNEDDDVNDGIGTQEFQSLNSAAAGLSTGDKIKFFEIHLQKVREYFAKNTKTIQNINEFTEKRVTEENLRNAIEELHEEETLNDDTIEHTSEPPEKCKTKNPMNESREGQQQEFMQSIPNSPTSNESRKFHTQNDFYEIERQYAAQNKSKSELLVFYKSQLSHVMKLIAGCTASNVHTQEQKRDLYEFLSDRISSLREEIQREKQIKLEENFVDDDDIDINPKQSSRIFDVNSVTFELDDFRDDANGNCDRRRRINFAPQPSVCTFFEDDEPCIVSQQNENNLMDATFEFFNSPSNSSASSVCDDDDEDNKHVGNNSDSDCTADRPVSHSDHQNRHMKHEMDCDMNVPMNQINECTMNNKVEGRCSNVANSIATAAVAEIAAAAAPTVAPNQNIPTTLILQFNHSTNACTATVSNDDDTINSPLDIYKQFGSPTQSTIDRTTLSSQLSLDAINRPRQLDLSVLTATKTMIQSVVKEKSSNDNNGSFLAGIKPIEVPNIDQKPSKSILKKKNLVCHEIRAPENNDDFEDSLDTNTQSDGSTKFTQVLGEIVEHSDANETNITSQLNYIETIPTQISDACNIRGQPKKRISLFKKNRMS